MFWPVSMREKEMIIISTTPTHGGLLMEDIVDCASSSSRSATDKRTSLGTVVGTRTYGRAGTSSNRPARDSPTSCCCQTNQHESKSHTHNSPVHDSPSFLMLDRRLIDDSDSGITTSGRTDLFSDLFGLAAGPSGPGASPLDRRGYLPSPFEYLLVRWQSEPDQRHGADPIVIDVDLA
jgi:hypothetical protein